MFHEKWREHHASEYGNSQLTMCIKGSGRQHYAASMQIFKDGPYFYRQITTLSHSHISLHLNYEKICVEL